MVVGGAVEMRCGGGGQEREEMSGWEGVAAEKREGWLAAWEMTGVRPTLEAFP
jgi:hypothetical protein